MNGDAYGKQNEKKAEGPMFSHKDGAVEQRNPDHADGQDLDLQRYSLMYHEVLNVRSQFRMIHKPVIHSPMAAKKQRCGKQKQRSSRQHRQKYAQYRQP